MDTNVLVSAVATRGLCADVLQVILAEHELVLGETVLRELTRVLRRKVRVSAGISDEMDAFLRRHALVVPDAPPLHLTLRDRTDLPVLAEAVAGRAEVLVTGDRDLHGAAVELPLPVLTPREFWERIRRPPTGRSS